MQKDERPAPAPETDAGQEPTSEEARDNLEIQEDAAKEREENRGYQ